MAEKTDKYNPSKKAGVSPKYLDLHQILLTLPAHFMTIGQGASDDGSTYDPLGTERSPTHQITRWK